ncbi:hypothetical protein TNCV_402611 [Trichonephila clavipes]|nr:hypothetical protein TNCV_402611 [Trichonephila clavipes]
MRLKMFQDLKSTFHTSNPSLTETTNAAATEHQVKLDALVNFILNPCSTPIIHFIGLLGSPSLPSSTPLVPASETPPTIPPSRNTKPTISPDRGRRNQFLIPVPCEIQQCCVV